MASTMGVGRRSCLFKCTPEDVLLVLQALKSFDYIDPAAEKVPAGVKFKIDLALLPRGDGPCVEEVVLRWLTTVVALHRIPLRDVA